MKRRIPVSMVISMLLALAWFALPMIASTAPLDVGSGEADTTIFVPGELIVKFKPGVSVKPSVSARGIATTGYGSIDMLNQQYGVTSLEEVFKTAKKPVVRELFDFSNIYILKLPEDADVLWAVEAYQNDPNVEYAEPNYIYHTCIIPNDQYLDLQWALNQASDHDIDAPEAWDIETGDASIVIAIIDTGVDWDHPDLAANVWNNTDEIVNGSDTDGNGYIDDIRGWDFAYEYNNPMDYHGHGTHCAGIAGAVTNNSIGIAGVCWNCTIMPVKGLNNVGSGSASDLSNAIRYAADNGADVISMSWGSYDYSGMISNALNYAYNNGVVLVAGAGNDGISNKFYPAGRDNVIAVSATNSNDAEASFSNYGSWVDVAAPGVSIYSTICNDTYGNKSGTSMSCPHVAGLVGLLLSKNSSLTQMEVRTILRSTTDSVTSGRYIGLGRINAHRAIQVDSTTIANFYYIEDIDIAGEKNRSKIIKVVVPPAQPIPKEFRLLQNFPNPFNPDTWLPYELAADAPVSIHIYNLQGQLVRQLNPGKQEAGYYVTKDKAAYWDGRNADDEKVASGIYWYTLQAGEFNAIRRMVILK